MLVDMTTISYSALLQANATVMGLLILVTISPLTKLFEQSTKEAVIFTVNAAILFLAISIFYLLFYPPQAFFIAKIAFIIGVYGVPATLVVLLFYDRILAKLHIRRM